MTSEQQQLCAIVAWGTAALAGIAFTTTIGIVAGDDPVLSLAVAPLGCVTAWICMVRVAVIASGGGSWRDTLTTALPVARWLRRRHR